MVANEGATKSQSDKTHKSAICLHYEWHRNLHVLKEHKKIQKQGIFWETLYTTLEVTCIQLQKVWGQ